MNIKMNFENGELSKHITANNSLFSTTATVIKNLTVENDGLNKRKGLKYLTTLDGYGKIIPLNNIFLVLTYKKITAFDNTGDEITSTTAPYLTEHLDTIDWVVNNNKLYLAEKHYNLATVELKDDLLFFKQHNLKNLNENPAHITFYANRLIVAGTNINPSKIYMSKIGDYFDFDIGSALPDEAIELYLTSDDETITGIVASSNLQVFTTNSEWKISGIPMTPQTVSVIKQSSYGSKHIKPIIVGGTTIFIPKKSGTIRNFVYSELNGGYISQNLCEYAPHLLDNITEMIFANNKIFLISPNYMTIGTIFKNHIAFTKLETNGIFISIGTINDKVFIIVNRNGNFLLEVFDNNFFIDSFVNFKFDTPTKKITELLHLKNMKVMVMADDIFYNTFVDDDGQLELSKPAKNITVGIPYEYLLLPNSFLSSNLSNKNGFKLQDLKLMIKTAKSFELDTGNGFETIDWQYNFDTYDYLAPKKELKGMIKITGSS